MTLRLTGITYTGASASIAEALYTLDAAGNRTAKTTTTGTETYGYDALNRLTSAPGALTHAPSFICPCSAPSPASPPFEKREDFACAKH